MRYDPLEILQVNHSPPFSHIKNLKKEVRGNNCIYNPIVDFSLIVDMNNRRLVEIFNIFDVITHKYTM